MGDFFSKAVRGDLLGFWGWVQMPEISGPCSMEKGLGRIASRQPAVAAPETDGSVRVTGPCNDEQLCCCTRRTLR